ncbi:MAG: hypothetical protein OQJ93_02880 [Ignavibacteriaceae bacterium]|jgi:hypothetical protein|nr:hypothetical protein [Ignavibacteriaceae bacterium]MCW8812099.1 hypothetical protein [Chlorobium sp.]MCW8818273.1 hypothetical protein [Ignavibacteriaceae bacterium]MCW8961286.1 hypothetical protein [Ignavibacteriaceae bacterium]MCW9096310.1 hypothetical protein [Ignavibacteriaceae bacterium]
MNLLTKITLILTFASCNNFLFGQDCKATVSIKTDVDKAKLFVDDVYAGMGNNFITKLDSGRHVIYITENFWKWKSKSISDTINIFNCSDIILNYSLNGQKILNTEPQDVYVFKGDSLIGFTPLLLDLQKGKYTLEKPDYTQKTINFQEIVSGEKPELQFVGQEKGKSFYETTLFKVLVGTALALGATTAYYKLEADKKFDEYQITGNPELLDQTNRYDLISGVTFVAMQINFGLILYLFLSD